MNLKEIVDGGLMIDWDLLGRCILESFLHHRSGINAKVHLVVHRFSNVVIELHRYSIREFLLRLLQKKEEEEDYWSIQSSFSYVEFLPHYQIHHLHVHQYQHKQEH